MLKGVAMSDDDQSGVLSADSKIAAGEGVDSLGRIETRGIDFIPYVERHSSPRNLAWVMVGCQYALGIVLFGSLPIAFGLGFWGSVTSITVGLAIGSILYAPTGLIGPRTGTNNAVSSGAYFGVRGRVLGSAIALFTGLGFAIIDIFTAGQMIVFGFHRLFDTGTGKGALALAIAVVTALVVVLGLYGHATLVAAFKFVAVTSGLILVASVFVLLPDFRVVHPGNYLLGGYWSTWVLAVTIAASLPISYAPFVNDYGRYIPERASPRALLLYNGVGMFLGCWVALMIGAVMTASFKDVTTPFVQGLAGASPIGLIVPLIYVAMTGNVVNAALSAYNASLDFQSYFWRIRRVVIAGAVGVLLVAASYLSVVVFNEIDSVQAFVVIMIVTLTPWMGINVIGHFARRGEYRVLDLHAYATPNNRGVYWFIHGINLRGFVAWGAATAVGLLFTSTSIYSGPFSQSVNGIDLSWSSAAVISAIVYYALLKLFPEHGIRPAGGEIVPATSAV
jgi:purine-cytosine permease-like protein